MPIGGSSAKPPWRIRYFQEDDGSVPAALFEDSLPVKLAAKIMKFAQAVAEAGFGLGGGIFEACHGYADLFEIRAKVGKQLAREFCTVDGKDLILLSGVQKEVDHATPESAFVEAERLLRRYFRTRKTL